MREFTVHAEGGGSRHYVDDMDLTGSQGPFHPWDYDLEPANVIDEAIGTPEGAA